MNKKIWLSGILVLLLAVTAGCGQKPEAKLGEGDGSGSNHAGNSEIGQTIQEPPNNPVAHGAGNSDDVSPVQEQVKKTVIQTYFTDDQMNDLIAKEKEISYSDDEQKYMKTMKALQHSEASELLSLWGKVNFKEAKLDGGKLTVDLSLPDEARLGAGGESLAVESLTKALFQFDEVKSIEVLIDGQQAETLMGHVELEHPFLRK
ncbi:GerMN domain-containing protein [Paenibacillus bouchesdurhonensis]|uniref:GerMN domain-containing protein n=1 Tax=Paenibacillus bouchesdurhonensis TaxID=1870990 RepID=UPI000DA62441|nr:GerMN domain-containing protein [Paenibacillus bouchesdurhonensis]